MSRHGVLAGMGAGLIVVCGTASAWVDAEDGTSALKVETVGEERSEPAAVTSDVPQHEALASVGEVDRSTPPDKERVVRVPPEGVPERPAAGPTKPGSQWVGGYWSWDKTRKNYVWVTGLWQVPPPGTFWVNGYWRRDEHGWYRVPGFWSARADGEPERQADWKKDGPPPSPSEDVGPAPGPNYFYVAGIYTPDENGQLVWKRGFWAPEQSGWEWTPARWVRGSSGWAFRPGAWKNAEPSAEEIAKQAKPTTNGVPPGYPRAVRSYPPQYGAGMWGGGGMLYRVGGFLNQFIP